LVASPQICQCVSELNPIAAFEAVLDRGSEGAKQQAAGALHRLAIDVPTNQEAVAEALVRVLASDALDAVYHAVQLADELALDVDACHSMAAAGAIPQLVRQIEAGSEQASAHASKALVQISQASPEWCGEVTHELISARHDAEDESGRVRAERTLSEVNAAGGDAQANEQALGMAILLFRLSNRD